MKYAFAAVALAAIAQAQTLADIPECALPALDKSIADNTDCKTTDLACVCENFDKVQGQATAQVLKDCGADVAINEVLPAAEKLCANPPPAGGEETSSAAAPEETKPAEESKPAETTAAYETKPAPEETKPVETSVEPTPIPLPSPTDVVEPPTDEPEPTPIPTAAAASLGPISGLAMLVLGALAL